MFPLLQTMHDRNIVQIRYRIDGRLDHSRDKTIPSGQKLAVLLPKDSELRNLHTVGYERKAF